MYGLMIILYLGGLIFLSIVLEEIRRQVCMIYQFVYIFYYLVIKHKKIW